METSDRGMIDIERYDEADTPFLHGRISETMLEAMRNASAGAEFFDAFIDVSQASERGVASLQAVGTTLVGWSNCIPMLPQGVPMRPKSSEAFSR